MEKDTFFSSLPTESNLRMLCYQKEFDNPDRHKKEQQNVSGLFLVFQNKLAHDHFGQSFTVCERNNCEGVKHKAQKDPILYGVRVEMWSIQFYTGGKDQMGLARNILLCIGSYLK